MLATGWSPDEVLDRLSRRQSARLLRQVAAREARHAATMLRVFRTGKADKLLRQLEKLANTIAPAPAPATGKDGPRFEDGLAELADKMGNHSAARRIRVTVRAADVLGRLRERGFANG